MRFSLRLEDRQLLLTARESEKAARSLNSAQITRFKTWAASYEKIAREEMIPEFDSLEPLLAIGQEIGAWLETQRWLTHICEGSGPIFLDIAVGDSHSEAPRALLDVPWELLAGEQGFLAQDRGRPFCVQRRIGGSDCEPCPPRYQSLALMFMAASPRNVTPVLDYEAEEAAILKATEGLPLEVTVEESGCLDFLGLRLSYEGPFEALHLSCHGAIVEREPKLLLESPEGDRAAANASEIVAACGAKRPALVFLSACRTAEHRAQSAPLAMELLRFGVGAVLGWDGSVLDSDATAFATAFYGEMARCQSPAYAAAVARSAMLEAHVDDAARKTCRHWHMARLYAGPAGGGPLCAADAATRPSHRGAAYNAFLDKERAWVPVAGPMAFVGRRREAQNILGVFRNDSHPGVLIHAIGGQGKSSLAARVADRMPRHRTAVVFGAYHAKAIFEAVLSAVTPEKRGALRERWEETIANDGVLRDCLETILSGPCVAYDESRARRPLLLVIDDLEQALEPPLSGPEHTQVKAEYRSSLTAVIEAFDQAQRGVGSQARLILTSRYDFALPNAHGIDLAGLLHKVPLRPFDDNERVKQQRAACTELGEAASRSQAPVDREKLLARARKAGLGNPLIQAMLTRLALSEPDAAASALREMEHYIARGETRDHAKLGALFERLALDVYRAALSDLEKTAFRAMTLFDTPVPKSALLAAAAVEAPGQAEATFGRLLRLGLLDPFEAGPPTRAAYMASRLARPLFDALLGGDQPRLAKAALPALLSAWTIDDDWLVTDVRALEVWRLAQIAGDVETLGKAALSGGGWFFHRMQDAKAALILIQPAIEALHSRQIEPHPLLLKLGIDCADHAGEARLLDDWLAQSSNLSGGNEKMKAILRGQQVERLRQRGEEDEALRILREEQLPVYERLADVGERAVTMGTIAQILFHRGDVDEALRIHREEQLPAYERIGDVRGRAVTLGRISEILASRGDLDEALRILRDELLPVFERLGKVHARAVTLGHIADVLYHRGDLDEALHILKNDRLPVVEQQGDVQGRANTIGQIARILARKGDLSAARHLQEEHLEINRRLGDVHGIGATLFELALLDMEEERMGEAAPRMIEAYRIMMRLGRAEFIAGIGMLLGPILANRQQPDDARTVLRRSAAIFRKLGREKEALRADAVRGLFCDLPAAADQSHRPPSRQTSFLQRILNPFRQKQLS